MENLVDLVAETDDQMEVCLEISKYNCTEGFVDKYGYKTFLSCVQYMGRAEYISLDEFKMDQKALFISYGVILNIICLIGVIGNILSLIVMCQPTFRRTTVSVYLQALMIVDSFFLITNYIHYVLVSGLDMGRWLIDAFPSYSRVYLFFNIGDMLRNCTALLTVAVTIDRYIYVCHSFRAIKFRSIFMSRVVVLGVMGLCIVYEIPRFFILKVIEHQDIRYDCQPMYHVVPANIISSRVEDGLSYAGTAVFFLIPLVVLTVLTILLLLAVRRSHKFRRSMQQSYSVNDQTKSSQSATERSTTAILLSVVITFLLCNLPNTIIVVLRMVSIWDKLNLSLNGSICYYVAIILVNLNSAINVVLFCFFGKKFRQTFIQVFLACKRQRNGNLYNTTQTTQVNIPLMTINTRTCDTMLEGENSNDEMCLTSDY